MVNFVVIVDPDLERRSHFMKTIEPHLSLVEGLTINSCLSGDFHAIWAANSQAPMSWVGDSTEAAVIWGEAIAQRDSTTRIDASTLKNLWTNPTQSLIFDGFYAAVVYHRDRGFIIGTDILGLFPLYYYTQGDVALVASSPELFRYHPLFPAKFNPAGLVGILLTNGLFEGETLWQGVRRLSSGYLLNWMPGDSPKEIKQYEIPKDKSDRKSLENFNESLEELDKVLDDAIASQAPKGTQYSILLSGGLDSRMLSGYLHRQGADLIALTLGIPSDIEMECALPVARTLNIPHHSLAIPYQDYPSFANLVAKWEHLGNGCNFIMNWGIHSHLQHFGQKVVTGYLVDRVIGGLSNYYLPLNTLSFESFFHQGINPWGLSPNLLKKLLHPEVFGDLVSEQMNRLQAIYESYSEEEFKRTWFFELYHRQRFHIGIAAWQLSFGSWPVLPILNQKVIETAANLPVEAIAKRRAQNELVCQQFPKLGALPLDRNAFNMEPLLPSQTRQRLAFLFRFQQKWRQWQQKQGIERRYYYRTFDINNPGWQAVRRQAEPNRERIKHLFNKDIFNQILPPPDVPIQFEKDGIIEASGMKALLGFLLWVQNHL